MAAWLFVCLCWFGWCWFGLVVGFDAGVIGWACICGLVLGVVVWRCCLWLFDWICFFVVWLYYGLLLCVAGGFDLRCDNLVVV